MEQYLVGSIRMPLLKTTTEEGADASASAAASGAPPARANGRGREETQQSRSFGELAQFMGTDEDDVLPRNRFARSAVLSQSPRTHAAFQPFGAVNSDDSTESAQLMDIPLLGDSVPGYDSVSDMDERGKWGEDGEPDSTPVHAACQVNMKSWRTIQGEYGNSREIVTVSRNAIPFPTSATIGDGLSKIADDAFNRRSSRRLSTDSRHWSTRQLKRQRKLCVLEIFGGTSRKLMLQTPEVTRMIHSHNKQAVVEDNRGGSVKLRDLRQVCSFQSGHRPSIEPRRNCILVNLSRTRCVILHNKILTFPFHPNSSLVDWYSSNADDEEITTDSLDALFLEKITRLTGVKGGLLLEFAALEAMLIEECNFFSTAAVPMKAAMKKVMRAMQMEPSKTAQLHKITDLKRRIDNLSDRVTGFHNAIQEVLDNEEDLRRLEISRFWQNPDEWDDPSDSTATEDAEILLECYEQEVEGLLAQLRRMDEELDDALQIQQLHLASVRNLLIKSELGLEVVDVVIGLVAAVAGIFGMNIPSGLEQESAGVFWKLTFAMGCLILFTMLSVFWFFRRLPL